MKFEKGLPVWKRGEQRELNSRLLFSAPLKGRGTALLRVAANSFYKAYLNGKFLAFGPARAAHGYYRVDEIVLEGLQGDDVLVVEAVGYNCRSFYSLNTPAFLQAEVLLDGEIIAWTGRDFVCRTFSERLRKVSRFSYQRGFMESYRFSKNPTSIFAQGVEGEAPVVVEGGKLLPRSAPYPKYEIRETEYFERGSFRFIEDKPLYVGRYMQEKRLLIFPMEEQESRPTDYICRLEYEKGRKEDGVLSAGEYAAFQGAYSETGFLSVEGVALEDCHFYLIFDEVNGNEGKAELPADIDFQRNMTSNVVEYKVAAGEFLHTSFEPYTAKFLKIVLRSGKMYLPKISILSFENPWVERFSLTCADKRVERIVDAAKRTLRHNAVDILTDCPSRERAGWLCDAYFSARAEKLFTGENVVEGAFLENYQLAPDKLEDVPEKMIGMCYPADFEDGVYIPNWAMWYIVELADREIREKNREEIDKAREKVFGVLEFLSRYENEEGLLENLEGWVFIEWSKANDAEFVKGVNFPSNMLYAKALECAGKLYSTPSLREKAGKIRAKVRELSFNGEFFEDNAVRKNGRLTLLGHTTETCQYYAFFTDTATREKYDGLFMRLVERFTPDRDEANVYPTVYKSNAFIGDYLRLELLRRYGYLEKCADECVQFFDKMARLTGTLWENNSVLGSLDHGFAAYAANILVEYLSGFRVEDGQPRFFADGKGIDCDIRIPTKEGTLRYTRQRGKVKTEIS